MSNKKLYQFEVKTLESGQRRAYGDSYYHFIIENKSDIDYHESVIRDFCTGFLRKAVSEKRRKEQIEKDKADGQMMSGAHFAAHYTKFEKIGDRKFEYKVVEPSTH